MPTPVIFRHFFSTRDWIESLLKPPKTFVWTEWKMYKTQSMARNEKMNRKINEKFNFEAIRTTLITSTTMEEIKLEFGSYFTTTNNNVSLKLFLSFVVSPISIIASKTALFIRLFNFLTLYSIFYYFVNILKSF